MRTTAPQHTEATTISNTQPHAKKNDNPLQFREALPKYELLQKKHNPLQLLDSKYNPLQKVTDSHNPLQMQVNNQPVIQHKAQNNTGLPNSLKAGVEQLSGIAMDDVNVHYNSDKPAQLQALAYAQGTDIHVAPGQERHLPHEAWHVVQQKQGRVYPTTQLKGNVPVNNDKGLEHEADIMGAKATGMNLAAGKDLHVSQLKAGAIIQRYTEAEVIRQKGLVKAAVGSGKNVLDVNKAAQTALSEDEDEEKKLHPHFTSMGIEVEFAQQPPEQDDANDLAKAHVIVSKVGGFDLYTGLDFILETDAAKALEFVTAPLLAPLPDGARESSAEPDKAWSNAARKAIEFSLRAKTETNRKLSEIVNAINTDFGLNFAISRGYENILYGNIDKFGDKSHTTAQLNFMGTLDDYVRINRAAGGGSSVTEDIFKLVVIGAGDAGSKSLIYALCQKIREIPSILVDETFSIILRDDETPEKTETSKDKAIITKSKGDKVRATLSSTASHIKDETTLWLKASFHQLLAASLDQQIGAAKVISELVDKKASDIIRILLDTEQVEALKPFYNESQISNFVSEELTNIFNITSSLEEEYIESDIENKPAEQKEVLEKRRDIIGARPDTYVPHDEDIAKNPLFLMETRKTTSYLGLKKKDRYK